MPTVDSFSREERNLYNPAFMAVLVTRAVQGFEQQNGTPCHVLLAVLAPVMALTPQLRAVLPSRINATTVNWIEREAAARVHLSQFAPHFGPIVKHGLAFGLNSDLLELVEGNLVRSTGRLRKSIGGDTEEVIELQKASQFIGRWLARAGDMRTVFTLMGVRP